MIAGPPDHVGEKLAELEEAGIQYLNCWADVGGYPHAKVMRTLELFGTDVLPHFIDKPAANSTGSEIVREQNRTA